jgi:RNA polymerase sigma-70 factor (ECF subfamily)
MGAGWVAEDLMQDAFVRVIQKVQGFRGDSAFSTWLHRVAVNTVLMHRRRSSREGQGLRALLELVEMEEMDGGGNEERVDLMRALDRLAPGYRRAIVLHEFSGLEHAEIARLQGRSVGTSKSQLAKAKAKLAQLLTPSPAGSRKYAGSEKNLLHCVSNVCIK